MENKEKKNEKNMQTAAIRQPIVSLLGHPRHQKSFCSFSFQSIIDGK